MRTSSLWIGALVVVACGDNRAPDSDLAVTFDEGPPEATNRSSSEFRFHAADAVRFTCAVDGGAAVECSSPHTATTNDGDHALTVTAFDAAGGAGDPSAYEWRVDTAAPDTAIAASPPALANSHDATFELAALPAADLARFECRVDGAVFATCASPLMVQVTDGSHAFEVRAIDAVGNVDPSPARYDWTVDTVGPALAITGGPDGPTNDVTPSFTFTTDGVPMTIRCRVDADAFGDCTTATSHTAATLAAGPHTFEVRVADVAGNPVTAMRGFEIDLDGPTVSITAGPGGPVNTPGVTFTFTTAGAPTTIECRFDSGTFAPCPGGTATATLAEGPHVFEVRVVDLAGNAGNATRGFTIDLTPPTVTITGGPSGPTASATPTFTFTTAGGAVTVQCRVDAGAPVGCSGTFTTSSLGGGAHTFAVIATDAAGNPGSATRTFSVDTTAPSLTITTAPPDPTNDPTPTFVFTAPGAATITCSLDAAPPAPCTSPFTLPDLAEGAHTFQVRACNTADVCATDGRTFTVDLTGPTLTIDSGPADPTPTGSATPIFGFTAGSDATTRCRVTSVAIPDPAFVPCTGTFTSAALVNGAYVFEVQAIDAATNTTTRTRAFTVQLQVCGDGVRTGTELCDQGDLGTATCATQPGFDGGVLGCTSSCTFETAACTDCGNGVREGTEACDGAALGGATCNAQGFTTGAMACSATCTLATAGCFRPAATGFTGRVCVDGIKFPQPANGSAPVACSETAGGFRASADTNPIWSSINGTGAPTTTINNPNGRAIFSQQDGPSYVFFADNSIPTNAYRGNNFSTWTQFSMASGGAPFDLFAARLGTSNNNLWGGWHPTLGAVVLHGNFGSPPLATVTASPIGAGITGTVRAIVTGTLGVTTDVLVAVHGQTPTGAAATGGGIYWTCDQLGAAGGTYIPRDNGLAASDKPLVWSLTVDPLTFTTATRTCPTTGGTVGGFASTWYAGLRGGGQVYKTVDGGVTWTQSNTGLPPGAEVYGIAIDCYGAGVVPGQTRCADRNLLYAATSVGLFRSTNAGATWTAAGFEGSVVRAVALLPQRPVALIEPRIYVGVDDAVGIYLANPP